MFKLLLYSRITSSAKSFIRYYCNALVEVARRSAVVILEVQVLVFPHAQPRAFTVLWYDIERIMFYEVLL